MPEASNKQPLFSLRVPALLIVASEFVLLAAVVRLSSHRDFPWLLFTAESVGLALLIFALADWLRWRGRINLKIVLSLFTLMAIALGIFSQEALRASRQQQLATAVAAVGGQVSYDSYESNDPGWTKSRSGFMWPDWIVGLIGRDMFQDVWAIWLDLGTREQLDTIDVELINELQCVRTVDVRCRELVPGDFAKLASIETLEDLMVGTSTIELASFEMIANMPNLRGLYLIAEDIDAVGLRSLQGLNKLENVRFDGPGFDDRALAECSSLKQIKSLILDGTKVSQSAVDALQKQLPDCRIFFH